MCVGYETAGVILVGIVDVWIQVKPFRVERSLDEGVVFQKDVVLLFDR